MGSFCCHCWISALLLDICCRLSGTKNNKAVCNQTSHYRRGTQRYAIKTMEDKISKCQLEDVRKYQWHNKNMVSAILLFICYIMIALVLDRCLVRSFSPRLTSFCVTFRRTLSLTGSLSSRTLGAPPRAPPRWRERTWEVGGLSTVLLTQVWHPLDGSSRHARCHLHIQEIYFHHNRRVKLWLLICFNV